MDMDNLIDKIVKKSVSELIEESRSNDTWTSYQKTETLLYNYPKFKDAIVNKTEDIDCIQKEGVPQKSKSIVHWSSSNSVVLKDEFEKAEEAIDKIQDGITEIKYRIGLIDSALESIKNDTYFDVIRMKYFENKSREEIAEYYHVDVRTITRNKHKLVNLLQIRLFTNDFLTEMGLIA